MKASYWSFFLNLATFNLDNTIISMIIFFFVIYFSGWLESRRRIWRRHEPKTRRFWKQSRVPRKSKLGRLPLSFFCVFWYLFPLILYYKTILLHTCTYNLITHFLQVFFEIEIQNAMLKIK